MFNNIRWYFIILYRKLKWYLNNKPMKTYSGFNCGLCGKWTNKEFTIPEYDSAGEWWDTWGVCDNHK